MNKSRRTDRSWRPIRWALTGVYLLATLVLNNLMYKTQWRYDSVQQAIDGIRAYERPVQYLGQIRTEREILVAWMFGLVLIHMIGRTRRAVGLVVLQWAPFALALFLYDFARSVGYQIHGGSSQPPMSITPQIRLDEFFGGGRLPTTILQERFYDPDVVHTYDVIVAGVYTSHFLVPYLFAGYLWVRGQRLWRWYAGMFVSINFTACAIFAFVTTAPPWWAAREGYIPEFERKLATRGWGEIGLNLVSGAIDKGQQTVNPFAAIPSLHSAQSMLIVACLWPLVWKWARPLLLAYPAWMTFTLVYSGEHYFVDVLAGWGLVALALTGGWFLRKRFGWTSPFLEPRIRLDQSNDEETVSAPTIDEPSDSVPPTFEPVHEIDPAVRA